MKAEDPLIATDGESENQTKPSARFKSREEGRGHGVLPRPQQLFISSLFPYWIGMIYNPEYKLLVRIFRVREGARRG